MRNYAKEIAEFYEYVYSFYNLENGIYPIATSERIQEAINQYLESKPLGEIHFDSLDREFVRKIIQPEFQIF